MAPASFDFALAPEILQGAPADARSDIFSLGCVLYEMATGRCAFEGKSHAACGPASSRKTRTLSAI